MQILPTLVIRLTSGLNTTKQSVYICAILHPGKCILTIRRRGMIHLLKCLKLKWTNK